MWPNSLNIEVSRETGEKLKIYHALLLKWQKAINLVSRKTIDEAWIRHFADSAQIEAHVSRESGVVVDMGSGAGFPGMVLAIMKPELKVHMIESDERKCEFLRTVSRETNVDVSVHASRIEEGYNLIKPDIVIARALSDLSSLLEYVMPWAEVNPDLECVFLKGAQAKQEIEAAKELYDFTVNTNPSKTDSEGCILKIKNICKI
ncbi:MAG: 16S rRNA (guanine(527)-N(7))-methyltransferase RsmG [Pseudomonadota bacterium]